MLSILSDLCSLAVVSVLGGRRARRDICGALDANNRELRALHAHHVAGGVCFDRMMVEWNERLYPDYRMELNRQRAKLVLRTL